MRVYAITLEEAIEQGSKAWTMSCIASYYRTRRAILSADITEITRRKKPGPRAGSRLRELHQLLHEAEFMVKHFTHLAKKMRERGAI
jgi:hypothetical protein